VKDLFIKLKVVFVSHADGKVIEDGLEQITKEINDVQRDLGATNSFKNVLVSQIRSDRMQQHFQLVYSEVHRSLTRDASVDPPPLPIFCVGSRDFLALAGLDSGEALVFQNEADTSIPKLAEYIRRLGEHRSLTDASAVLTEVHDLLGLVHAHFKACTNKSRRLNKYESATAGFLRELENKTQERLQVTEAAVNQLLHQLERDLELAVQTAEDESETIFQSLVGLRWNVYSAVMRHHGEWKGRDLNEDLTKEIFLAISPNWNAVMNGKVPAILEGFVSNICKTVEETVGKICKRSKTCTTITDTISKASLSIGYAKTMTKAESACHKSLVTAQRNGNRFRSVLQAELVPHYDNVGAERGRGMFLRMQEENSRYILENHKQLFAVITSHAFTSFEDIRSAIHTHMTEALQKIGSTIYTSLVCVQHCTKLDTVVQERMRKEKLPALDALIRTAEPSIQALSTSIEARLKMVSPH